MEAERAASQMQEVASAAAAMAAALGCGGAGKRDVAWYLRQLNYGPSEYWTDRVKMLLLRQQGPAELRAWLACPTAAVMFHAGELPALLARYAGTDRRSGLHLRADLRDLAARRARPEVALLAERLGLDGAAAAAGEAAFQAVADARAAEAAAKAEVLAARAARERPDSEQLGADAAREARAEAALQQAWEALYAAELAWAASAAGGFVRAYFGACSDRRVLRAAQCSSAAAELTAYLRATFGKEVTAATYFLKNFEEEAKMLKTVAPHVLWHLQQEAGDEAAGGEESEDDGDFEMVVRPASGGTASVAPDDSEDEGTSGEDGEDEDLITLE